LKCTRGEKGSMGAKRSQSLEFLNVQSVGSRFMSIKKCGSVSFTIVKNLNPICKRVTKKMEKRLKKMKVILDDEYISGIFEEEGIADDLVQVLQALHIEEVEVDGSDTVVEIHTHSLYDEMLKIVSRIDELQSYRLKHEAIVNTKYKTVAKKVKPIATQLPPDTDDHIRQAEKEPGLREARKIGHKFMEETLANLKIGGNDFLTELEKKSFQDMLSKHGKPLLLRRMRLDVYFQI